MRILILRGGALGDFLVTLPALRLLREHWPDARIELVGNARAGELGVLGGYLDAVHSQDQARWSALFSPQTPPRALTAWLAGFDLIVDYWPDPGGLRARGLPVRPGQTHLSAPAWPTMAPAARHFCEPLRALGLSTDDFAGRLAVQRLGAPAEGFPAWRRRSTAQREDEPLGLIAIHPGSGSPRKNWPRARWLELVERLDRPTLLVLGEAEHEWLSAVRRPDPRMHLASNLPLPALAAVLARCRLFLGHDSGVSHLAAAVGTPCLLLFGPTDPAMWAPPGDHVRVLRRGNTLDAISVDEVRTLASRADLIRAAKVRRTI
ncbi:MAG TPA: glycosyltransferase family 9 protein [Opitutaceae bacterium]|nr:glycosyltransferase family 9 protein [Opitutaceae bacterium]